MSSEKDAQNIAMTKAWVGEFNALSNAYKRESDRAAILLAVSCLDQALADGLKRVLVDDKKSVGSLLDSDSMGPLSSFSARIDLAYCMGFLPKSVRADFHILRKVRNHCAHHPAPTNFSDDETRKLCAKLKLTKYAVEAGTSLRETFLLAVAICLFAAKITISVEKRPSIPTNDFD